jgi:HAD superfamily phosphoserine phosphatase-like hydrolase
MSKPEGACPAPSRFAFVDVDGTLLDCSSERQFLTHLLRTGGLAFRSAVSFALGYLARPLATLSSGPGWNRRYLSGMKVSDAAGEAASFSEGELVPRMRPEVVSLLARLSSDGFSPVLLSASLRWLVEPLGIAIGAVEVISSDLEEEGGVLTGRLSSSRPWGGEKASLARRHASSAGSSISVCCALGDSASDIPLLSACGRAYAVHPSRALRKEAAARGWEIVEGPR